MIKNDVKCFKNIIGLDLSLTGTGIAIMNKTGNYTVARIGTKVKFGPFWARLSYSVDEIMNKISDHDIVFIEDYAFGMPKTRTSSLTKLAEFGGIIKMEIFKKTHFWPFTVSPTQLKKWISGIGNLPKKFLVTVVKDKYKMENSFKTDDEAVAFALADLGSFLIGREFRKLKSYEKEIIKKYYTDHVKIDDRVQALAKNDTNV